MKDVWFDSEIARLANLGRQVERTQSRCASSNDVSREQAMLDVGKAVMPSHRLSPVHVKWLAKKAKPAELEPPSTPPAEQRLVSQRIPSPQRLSARLNSPDRQLSQRMPSPQRVATAMATTSRDTARLSARSTTSYAKLMARRDQGTGERMFLSSCPEGRLPPRYFTSANKHTYALSDAATYNNESAQGAYNVAPLEVQERDYRGVPVGYLEWKQFGIKESSPFPMWWSNIPPSRMGGAAAGKLDVRQNHHLSTSM